ncbi:MAG: HEAT repeat domain-containing protein [Planctomycetota bacterium]
MRSAAFITLLSLAACGTTSDHQSEFSQPNKLMGQEIQRRIDEIRYQHRDVLFNNLLWLAQAGEQAIPALLDGLRHEDPKVRSNCAWVLGEMGDSRVIQYLKPLVQDQVESVRLEGARSMVALGDMNQVPVLIEGLDSERIQVRYLCHEALKTATKRDFDYDHLTDDKLSRSHAVYRWRRWWSEQSQDPFFASSYAQAHGIRAEDEALGQPAAPAGETNGTQPQSSEPKVETTTQPVKNDAQPQGSGSDGR